MGLRKIAWIYGLLFMLCVNLQVGLNYDMLLLWNFWCWRKRGREKGEEKVSLEGERKREKLCWAFFCFNRWIIYLPRVAHLNKNRRELDAFKWEGSRTLFFNPSRSCWVEKISQIPTQPNPTQQFIYTPNYEYLS